MQKGTARSAPSLGLRNRTERLSEYGERRAAVFGLGSVAADISIGVRFKLGTRKRRRVAGPSSAGKDNAWDAGCEIDTMDTHTIVFGMSPEGDIHPGYAL